MSVDRQAVGPWERFVMLPYSDGAATRVYLRASNGKYLCAESGGGAEVVANRDIAGPWETFERITTADGRYAFKTANGSFLRAVGGGGGILDGRGTQAAVDTMFAAQPQPYVWKDLEITFTDRFELIWNDRGSGAAMDGAFWRPLAPNGFRILGDMCCRGYDDANGRRLIAVVRDLSDRALRPVASYNRFWDDRGSGAANDVTVWEPVAPPGYRAIGFITTKGYGGPPPNDAMWCVREDLVVRGTPSTAEIWNDRGSGANSDFSAWGVSAPASDENMAQFAPGTFVGNHGYEAPTNLVTASVFRLPLSQVVPPATVLPRPQLGIGDVPPAISPNASHHTVYLPWFAVNDPGMSDLEKLVRSPVYRLEREDRYKCEKYINNRTSTAEQTASVSYTKGFSRTHATQFSETTTIKIGMDWETHAKPFGVGVKSTFKWELSQAFTYGWSNSTTSSDSQTNTFNLKVPAGKVGALFLVTSTIRLFRQDGSQVGTSVPGVAPNSAYYAEA